MEGFEEKNKQKSSLSQEIKALYDEIYGEQKQSPLIQNLELMTTDYQSLDIPDNSIIYCDPPYANTTGYKDKFNHEAFWEWCRKQANKGHQIFVSEYNAPPDFICVWQKEIVSSLTQNTGGKTGIEKLFTI